MLEFIGAEIYHFPKYRIIIKFYTDDIVNDIKKIEDLTKTEYRVLSLIDEKFHIVELYFYNIGEWMSIVNELLKK